jgi:hypothetical protein
MWELHLLNDADIFFAESDHKHLSIVQFCQIMVEL